MSGSEPFTEDTRRTPLPDPRAMWRVVLDRHANGADGRCGIYGDADYARWQWARELLADDQAAETRAAGRGERVDWGQDWRTSASPVEAAELPELSDMSAGPGVPKPVIPRRDTVLKIHEDNYCYGEGELVLRVTAVGEVQHQADGDWLMVAGVQVGWNGADACERQVAVRMSSLIPQSGPR